MGEARLRAAQTLLDARISAKAEAARVAAALFVDREAAERTEACASLWHEAEQREAERVVRDAVAATVAAMVEKVAYDEPPPRRMRAHEDMRVTVELLAAGTTETHAAGERERIERDLARLAGELGAGCTAR